jgi:aldehyde dehydrogenase (NAD+)
MNAGHLNRIYVDGEWVLPAGQGRASVIDPSTEEPVAQIALGNAQDVARAVDSAPRAFASWSVSSPQDRAVLLGRVHSLILERAEMFAQAISLEMGAAFSFARGTQVPVAAEHIRVARDIVGSYQFLTHRGDTAIVREAIGVRALITPWNWPLYQINNPAWDGHAPFGGYKRSGNGREYGREGFEEYLETKAILGFGQAQPA